ncbi:CoA transferase [Blastococcus brunescens]|uniref:CoA transferase n=1 Tax=Blastococcus brunescens TaxID=1564165 RepID=A0ABZ1B9V5_9ACTN|nr:CoA transferase [Blastococcus sp. BMG 8361]WRL67217.1 CoA transferase [Blastococcus sp. BMG 8361]
MQPLRVRPDGPVRGGEGLRPADPGESGLINVSGQPDAPAKIGIPITDLVAGSNATIAILAALQQRQRDRAGQYLDVAMLDSIMPWLGYYPHHVWHHDEEPERTGMHHQYITPYGPYPAGDGKLVNLAVADDRQWRSFCLEVIEAPELLDDPASRRSSPATGIATCCAR